MRVQKRTFIAILMLLSIANSVQGQGSGENNQSGEAIGFADTASRNQSNELARSVLVETGQNLETFFADPYIEGSVARAIEKSYQDVQQGFENLGTGVTALDELQNQVINGGQDLSLDDWELISIRTRQILEGMSHDLQNAKDETETIIRLQERFAAQASIYDVKLESLNEKISASSVRMDEKLNDVRAGIDRDFTTLFWILGIVGTLLAVPWVVATFRHFKRERT